MQKNNKRGLSILLALLTVLAVFAAMPVTALAVSGDDPNTCEILNSSGGSQGTYSFAGAYNVWSNGRTLKLLDNIETGQQLNLANTNHSIVLDLNGKTLTVTRAAVPLRIDNGSTLTVKGPGTLKVISTAENSVAVRVNNGTLAVTGGAVINADGTAGGNGISVYGGSKATVTTAAAGLTGTGAYSGVYVTGAGSEITVTGDVGGDGYGVYAADGAKVTINGAITSPYYIGLYIGSNRVSKNAGDYEATTTKPGYYTYTDGVNSVWVKNLPPVKPTIVRAAGDDRIKTTIEASKLGWTTANNVVLANSDNFPDALAGGPLAHALNAPILLTKGTRQTIEPEVLARITELGAKNAYILGGGAAVSAGIAAQLTGAGLSVTRLSGNDRYETAVAIGRKLGEIRVGAPEFVFVADGTNYPDALAASPVAALKGVPIIFTPKDKTGLNAVSANYAAECGAKKAVLLGGTGVVKPDVATRLTALGFTCERVSGEDRYETSAEIYKKYKSLFTGNRAVIATGLNFPDALTGGVLGAKFSAPLFLVRGTGATSAPIKTAIADLAPKNVYVLGGTAVVTNAVVNNHI